jgi:hypothetical protein
MRIKAGVPAQKALLVLETVFKKYNPSFPFEYKFVDQEFQKKFLTEKLLCNFIFKQLPKSPTFFLVG